MKYIDQPEGETGLAKVVHGIEVPVGPISFQIRSPYVALEISRPMDLSVQMRFMS
jgi:hypothetical protein